MVPQADPKSSLPSQRRLRTAGYYAAFVFLGLSSAVFGPTLPGLARRIQTPVSEMGILFSTRALGYLIGASLGGRLVDRIAGHPVLVVALVAMAAALGAIPLLPSVALLAIVLLLLGVAEGALDVGCNTLLVWVHRERVGPFMNALHFFFGLGSFLSPVIVAQAVSIGRDVSWAYWVLALAALPTAVWTARLSSPTRNVSATDGEERPVDVWPVILITAFFMLYVGAEVGFGGWISTYAMAAGAHSETQAAYLASAFWGAFTLGRLLAVPLAARVRPTALLEGGLVGALASLGVMMTWPSAPAVIWASTLGMGLSIAPIFATTLSLAEQRIALTGRIMGYFFIGASAGSMILPYSIGRLMHRLGPQAMAPVILIDLIAAAGVLVTYRVLVARRSG